MTTYEFMSKRGQLTIFIIIGILLVIVLLAAYTIFSPKITDDISAAKGEVSLKSSVTSKIEACIEEKAKEGLILIGAQGGVIDQQFLSQFQQVEYFDYNRTFYYVDGAALSPTTKEIEAQIENDLLKHLPNCINDLYFLQEQGFSITQEMPTVDVTIGEEKVLIDVSYPLDIIQKRPEELIREAEIVSINKFQVTIPVRLGKILALADKVLQQQVENGKKVCLTCLADLSEESGIDILAHPSEQDNLFFSFDDSENSLDDNLLTYQFVFGGRYR